MFASRLRMAEDYAPTATTTMKVALRDWYRTNG